MDDGLNFQYWVLKGLLIKYFNIDTCKMTFLSIKYKYMKYKITFFLSKMKCFSTEKTLEKLRFSNLGLFHVF